MTEYDSFRASVAASPVLQERWHAATEALIAEAKSRWGVDLTKEDLAESNNSALKLLVLTGERIGDPLETMAQNMPAIRRAKESRELRDAIEQEEHADHAAATEELYALNPIERIRAWRAAGGGQEETPKEQPSQMSAAERAAAIKRLETLRGSARISEARRLGLA